MMKKFIGIFGKKGLLVILYLSVVIAGLISTHEKGTRAVGVFSVASGKKVVLIDAGHGEWDSGKRGRNDTIEKDINLLIADKLGSFLELSGAFVVRTRSDDNALGTTKREDLKSRKDMSAELGADIFVSIHQNSYPRERVRGAQTFYYGNSEEGERLATTIQSQLKALADPDNNREAKASMDYYILKNATVPAVIVECGFLSNDEESELLNGDEYQNKVAWAIYAGIVRYFEESAP